MAASKLLVSFVILLSICYPVESAKSEYCEKIDFNRTIFMDFHQCTAQYLPQFVVKSYSSTSAIKPFRPHSLYFLSTDFVGYSCVESTRTFFMNSNTRIMSAVLLKAAEYVNIEISVYNTELNRKVYSWINGTSAGQSSSWFIMHGLVSEPIPRAVVEIKAYLTPQSIVAIEYINILNMGIQSPECLPDGMGPTVKPPMQQPAVTLSPNTPTKVPHTDCGGHKNNNDNIWWIVAVVCASVLAVVVVMMGIYCIFDGARSRYRHDCAAK